jgi:WD40 repeat protein
VSVALSPDGERPAFGSGEGAVIIWNYAKGAIENRLLDVHKGIVWDLAFSPDGKTIATAGDDSSIHLLDVASGKDVGSINTNNKVSSVTWDPNGGRLAAGVGPRVMAWNPSDLKTPIFDQNLQVDVNGVAWSPDGAAIAAATSFPDVSILDPNTGIVNLRLNESLTKKVESVAWSPDSRLLASGSADNLVHVWDVAKGRPATAPLKGHFNEVTSVAINHDKTILASGSKDGKIILWDLRTFKPFGAPLEVNGSDVNDLAFLPVSGRNLLASASRDKTAKLLEMITEQPLRASLASLSGQVISISADPNDALTAAALQETTLSTWNVRGGIQNPALPVKGTTLSAALSHDGKFIAVGNDSGGIEVFDVGSGSSIQSIDTQSDQVTALAISPDGQTLAAGLCNGAGISGNLLSCKDSVVQFWEVSSGNPVGTPIKGQNDFIFALAYSPDGITLATGGQDKMVNLWNVSSGEQVGLPMARHLDPVTSLAFSPDGLIGFRQQDTPILWDTPQTSRLVSPGRSPGVQYRWPLIPPANCCMRLSGWNRPGLGYRFSSLGSTRLRAGRAEPDRPRVGPILQVGRYPVSQYMRPICKQLGRRVRLNAGPIIRFYADPHSNTHTLGLRMATDLPVFNGSTAPAVITGRTRSPSRRSPVSPAASRLIRLI